MMTVRTMLGICLIILGMVNILHAIASHSGTDKPGVPFMVVTALFFTLGAWLLLHRVFKHRA